MVRDTSLEVYHRLKAEGLFSDRQVEILEYILRNPLSTDVEITEGLDQDDPNYVRPRRRELVQLGLLVGNTKRPCKITGNTAYVWDFDSAVTFEDVKRNQAKLDQFADEKVVNGFVNREIMSKSFAEAVAKAMIYADNFGIARKNIKILEAQVLLKDNWKVPIYRILIARDK